MREREHPIVDQVRHDVDVRLLPPLITDLVERTQRQRAVGDLAGELAEVVPRRHDLDEPAVARDEVERAMLSSISERIVRESRSLARRGG